MSKEAKGIRELLPAGEHHQITLGNLQGILLLYGKEIKLADKTMRIHYQRLCPGVYEVWLEEKAELVIRTKGKGFKI